METICLACNIKSYGMIGIYKHPKKLDEMITELSGFEVIPGDHLCIECYENLKSAFEFKKKIESSFETRSSVNGETRRKIIGARNDEILSQSTDISEKTKENEFDVMISSTSSINFNPNIESLQQHEDVILEKRSEIETTPINTEKKSNDEDLELNKNTSKPKKTVKRKSPRNHNKKSSLIKKRNSIQKEVTPEKEIEFVIMSQDDFDSSQDEKPEFSLVNSDSGSEIFFIKNNTDTNKNEEIEYEIIETLENETSHSKPIVKNHKCKYCSKSFRSKNALEGHYRSHTGDRPYLCTYCNKGFAEKGNLKQHIKSMHLNERNYVCSKCKTAFKTHYSHKVHERSCITKEKPYVCQICSKGFYSSGKLLLHTRVHTNERPYPCNYCASAFKDNTALKRHIGRVHLKSNEKVILKIEDDERISGSDADES
uniref:CSON010808 protein n=1 Tax=Culicoides sonorensis TaxID=179676 RepID=A0A336M7T8_CULSO